VIYPNNQDSSQQSRSRALYQGISDEQNPDAQPVSFTISDYTSSPIIVCAASAADIQLRVFTEGGIWQNSSRVTPFPMGSAGGHIRTHTLNQATG